ncbi:MAG TPA: SUF system NifU family Fe-S cluster assembly protein [Burkholderiaceae bacterium]
MAELRDLYQEVVIDHGRRPRNAGPLAPASHRAEGFNPLCGDRLTLYLRVVDGVIEAASFEGGGCAISTASASLMTEALKGRTVEQAEAMSGGFQALVTGHDPGPVRLGKLEVLAGVREFPARVKCATLAWHTQRAALHNDAEAARTEEGR